MQETELVCSPTTKVVALLVTQDLVNDRSLGTVEGAG